MINSTTIYPSHDDVRLVHSIVGRSKSSFYWAMRLLPKQRREAMFAIYALCRELDDIADGGLSVEEKLAELAKWNAELDALEQGRPGTAITRTLYPALTQFSLDLSEFRELIRGMEMDAKGEMCAPSCKALKLYCRRAAGTVGLLSVSVFGRTDPIARDFALALADALQLTNILRDIKEDAQRGRLYLPKELLVKHHIDYATPDDAAKNPSLHAVCAEIAKEAHDKFNQAERALRQGSRRKLFAAVSMMAVYREILNRLEARGWSALHTKLELSKGEKLWLSLKPLFWGYP